MANIDAQQNEEQMAQMRLQNAGISLNPNDYDTLKQEDRVAIFLKVMQKKSSPSSTKSSDYDNAVALPTAIISTLKKLTGHDIDERLFVAPGFDKTSDAFSVQTAASIVDFLWQHTAADDGFYLTLAGIDGTLYKLTPIDQNELTVKADQRKDCGPNELSFTYDNGTVVHKDRAQANMKDILLVNGMQLEWHAQLTNEAGSLINKFKAGFTFTDTFHISRCKDLKQLKDSNNKEVKVFFSRKFNEIHAICHICGMFDGKTQPGPSHLTCSGHGPTGDTAGTSTATSKKRNRDGFNHRMQAAQKKAAASNPFG
jgi:hypothetical protein